jgi:hypothetical protein
MTPDPAGGSEEIVSIAANSRRAVGVLAICSALVLPACSSSGSAGGDDGVSTQKIVDKLKSDPRVQAAKSQLGDKASKFDDVVDCIATAMKKDIKQSDLKAYVTGKKKLDDLATAKDKVATDATNCVKQVVGSS